MTLELSIILPTRNGADRLRPTIEALLDEIRRAGVAAEIIALDDLSTDDTPRILADMAFDNAEIRVEAGPGRGPGAARNAAARAAHGRLVAFADDDDLWTPGRLARQLAAHRAHPEAAFSLCDYAHLREDAPGLVLPSAFAYWPLWRRFRGAEATLVRDARALIAAENAVGTSTVMARRDAYLAVGGFDETLPSASDWDLWLRLAAAGPTLVLGVEGARYAMRAGSVSANRAARLEAMRAILARHADLPAAALRRAKARIATGLSEAAAEAGDRAGAIRHALQAMRLRPGRPQARRVLGLVREIVA